MRYPIFVFDEYGDLMVFESPADHWNNLEAYDIANPHALFDSNGRVLTMADAGNDRVKILDSDAEPDPERLREMAYEALQRAGQEWSSDTPLQTLVTAAQTMYGLEASGTSIGQAISSLLSLFRLRTPAPRVVTVENRCTQAIIVQQAGVATETLQPGRSRDFEFGKFEGAEVLEVKPSQDDAAGNTLVKQSFTWKDLGRRRIKLVVE